ncbi:hypothetical protein FD48_GL000019 [Lactiplantibacillus paraplantarum DSM 10667]|nr:hypothetical protein FD48_GL000019 [Lactiplantibacillus paraplantarum DSM 10667]
MLLPDNIEFIHGQAYWAEASTDGQDGYSNDGAVDGIDALFKLEQFTGLKDVDGKDIYEGDILATSSMIYGKNITDYLKVECREDYAGFYCGEKPLFACLGEWDNDIKFPQTYPEIVGDIHRNADLLEH